MADPSDPWTRDSAWGAGLQCQQAAKELALELYAEGLVPCGARLADALRRRKELQGLVQYHRTQVSQGPQGPQVLTAAWVAGWIPRLIETVTERVACVVVVEAEGGWIRDLVMRCAADEELRAAAFAVLDLGGVAALKDFHTARTSMEPP